jgi:DUF4097 and DUF4098 domain-containing protein YvlB
MHFTFTSGRLFFVCVSLLAAGDIAQAGQVVDKAERSFTVSGRPVVLVRNGDGRTRITAGSQSLVSVKAIKEVRNVATQAEALKAAERVQVRIEQSGNRIEVEAKYPKSMTSFFGNEPEVLVDFEITAPKASDIDARSSDGNLGLYGFDGYIQATAGDGEVTLDNCSGRIAAETGDGRLNIQSVRGDVSVRTGDGKISLDGVLSGLEARSGDGRIDINALPGSRMEKNWSIRTGDGDVRLGLPDGFGASLEITTSDGRIDSEQPITPEGYSSQNRLIGKLNNGGFKLRIQTSDGDIRIRRS